MLSMVSLLSPKSKTLNHYSTRASGRGTTWRCATTVSWMFSLSTLLLLISPLVVLQANAAPVKRKHWTEDTYGLGTRCLTQTTEGDKLDLERKLAQHRTTTMTTKGGVSVLSSRGLNGDTEEGGRPISFSLGVPDFSAGGPVVFNVSFNVIFQNESKAGGWIDDARITQQMQVLNDDYKQANISFSLVKTTRIHNPGWFNGSYPGSEFEQAMKRTHHIGDARTLNIYTLTFNSTTKSLGASSIPSKYASAPAFNDGILIRHSTISGGTRKNFEMGRTLTHEVGHWLGLFHTFQGGCDDGVGDGIADTPPQASGSEGCPVGRDSCEGGGPDLINNFMDYSYDACMDSFTPGQIKRMHESIATFRSSPSETPSEGNSVSVVSSTQ